MRVRGNTPVLWRGQGESQLGAEPGTALVLTGLSPREQQFLDRLHNSLEPAALYRNARWARIPVARARELVAELTGAGALADNTEEPVSPDEVYWDRLVDSHRERSAALKGAVVALLGVGSLLRETALLLAESGVGTLLTDDRPLGAALAADWPLVKTRAPLRHHPDLVVTQEAHVIDPVRARGLAQAGVVHLPVTVREVSVRVGPVIRPNEPVCSTCLDLWERDADPSWPALATQLRTMAPPATERLLTHQAAALAARAVIEVLTTPGASWRGRSVELSGAEPLGVVRAWDPHPECLCSSLT